MPGKSEKQLFPGFEYRAEDISKYIYSPGLRTFTLAVKNSQSTVHFAPEQPEQFKTWLDGHKIEDIGTP